MNTEHLISLIRTNCNNIDDLKKLQSAIECSIEALDIEQIIQPQPLPPTIQQLKQMTRANAVNANGTSLKGHIKTTYNELVAAFGEPCVNDGPSEWEKVTIEWILRAQNGSIVTIYDWKNYGKQPAPDEEFEWNIGGHHASAVALVKEAMQMLPV
jgi:hypothetical protein